MIPVTALFFIIFLEGYIVLSTELLAIRVLTPFTGSGTDTISIIIAAVLLPLALGYYVGGTFRTKRIGSGKRSIRHKLISNLLIAGFILAFGLSHVFLEEMIVSFQEMTGLYNRIILTALYALIFIAYPVFLLGQTVPLVSNYFSHEKLSYMAGRILFFSTLGSFMGAVFCTLVLMNTLGVHHTASITIGCMALLVLVLSRKKISKPVFLMGFCLCVTLALNSSFFMKELRIAGNNMYSTVQIQDIDSKNLRAFKLNRSYASIIYQNSRETYVEYIRYIEENFIRSIAKAAPPKSFLVLGAGGFTLGRTDTKNKYTFVDIDPQLKKISEEIFLKEKLAANKKFVPMDARAYLIQSKDKYDMIVLDLYRDPINMPENLVTREFFEQVKGHLKDGGIIVSNCWASPIFSDAFSRNLDYTFRQVFPIANRQIIGSYNAWDAKRDVMNIIYSAVYYPDSPLVVYTDNKNRAALDRPVNIPH